MLNGRFDDETVKNAQEAIGCLKKTGNNVVLTCRSGSFGMPVEELVYTSADVRQKENKILVYKPDGSTLEMVIDDLEDMPLNMEPSGNMISVHDPEGNTFEMPIRMC